MAAQVEAALVRADAAEQAQRAEAAAWQREEAQWRQQLAQAAAAQRQAMAQRDAANAAMLATATAEAAASAAAKVTVAQHYELDETVKLLARWLDQTCTRLPPELAAALRDTAPTHGPLAALRGLATTLRRLEQANAHVGSGTCQGLIDGRSCQVRYLHAGLAAWWWMLPASDATGLRAGTASLGDDGVLRCRDAENDETVQAIAAAFTSLDQTQGPTTPQLLPLSEPASVGVQP